MMTRTFRDRGDGEARRRLTTYWTVVALVIGAAVLVVLAFWHHLAPGDARRDRRWVALGTSFTSTPGVRAWATAIDVGPDVEGIDLTVPGATVSGMVAGQLGPALTAKPSAAVIWLGATDLLFGTPLTLFLRELTAAIGRLQRQGCAVLLVDLPYLPSASGRSGGQRKDPMAGATETVRTALRETAQLTGAIFVDIPTTPAGGATTGARVTGPVVWLEQTILDAVGRAVSPILATALRDGSSLEGSVAAWDEPADPVQRRRLGLPPVR